MTNNLVQEWKNKVLFPASGEKTLLMIDSWNGYGIKPEGFMEDAPHGKEIKVMVIPKNTTGMIQPLDVFGNPCLLLER